MVHIPLEALIAKIIEKSGLTRAQVDKQIAQKLEEFSGLISKEGAAHIVANELQVSITDLANTPFKINELKLGMKNITVIGKVLTKYNVSTFSKNGREGRVASLLLADLTGNIRVTFWHDDVLVFERLMENEVVTLTNLSVKENRSVLELTASSTTKIVRDSKDVDIESFAQLAAKKVGSSYSSNVAENSAAYEPGKNSDNFASSRIATTALRKPISQISVNDPGVEIVGVIVQVFKPASFTVDKATGKKVRLDPGMPADQLHHEQRFVMNIVVDDGTETIRAVFFGNECQQLVGKASLQQLKESEFEFSRLKTQLLGQTVRLTAKVVKNQLYDRLEIIVRQLELNPDASRELAYVLNSPILSNSNVGGK